MSRQPGAYVMTVKEISPQLQADLATLDLEIVVGQLANLSIEPTIMEAIKGGQLDPWVQRLMYEVRNEARLGFHVFEDGVLGFKGRICVSDDGEITKQIFFEGHNAPYAMHPGTTKMYQDLKKYFWWPGMKKETAEYVAHCLTCQQTKAEHQRPAGLLQPLEIPEWKWEMVTMDFVTGLPTTPKGHDAIWVIVDRLTKSAHFLPIKVTYGAHKLADIYIAEIMRLHGVPNSIVSDSNGRFTSTFWNRIQTRLGTKLNFSTSFHPQTDGQSERTIQTLEDMLRSCVPDFQGSWNEKLPLIEFAYNNSYHDSIKMAPYEALYGRKF